MSNMCALVLPKLLNKRKGVIVNVSSLAAIGFIGASPYSSTKAYASMLSECLQRTYKDSGKIFYTSYHPYYLFCLLDLLLCGIVSEIDNMTNLATKHHHPIVHALLVSSLLNLPAVCNYHLNPAIDRIGLLLININ